MIQNDNYLWLTSKRYVQFQERHLLLLMKIRSFMRCLMFLFPTLCPEERFRRRNAYRNEIYVFSVPSSRDGKMLFSMYPETATFPIVDKDYWWSDEFEALEYGRDFDFSRPFFEQFQELSNVVPHFPRSIVRLKDSDYSNNASNLERCYMVFNANVNQDCMYSNHIHDSRDCIDCTHLYTSELCYDSVMCSGLL